MQSVRIAIALVLLSAVALAAPARVQSTYGGGDGDVTAPITTANFGSSVTSGNWIIVFIRGGGTPYDPASVTDTLGTSYTLATSITSGSAFLWCYYGKVTASGTNRVTVEINTSWGFVFAVEVSGAAASSPIDVAVANNHVGGSDVTSSAFSTSVANEYVLLCATQATNVTYTAGTDFTLLNGFFPGNVQGMGGVEEYIPAATLSSYTAHITSTATVSGAVIVVSLKPAGGTPTPKPHRGVIF